MKKWLTLGARWSRSSFPVVPLKARKQRLGLFLAVSGRLSNAGSVRNRPSFSFGKPKDNTSSNPGPPFQLLHQLFTF